MDETITFLYFLCVTDNYQCNLSQNLSKIPSYNHPCLLIYINLSLMTTFFDIKIKIDAVDSSPSKTSIPVTISKVEPNTKKESNSSPLKIEIPTTVIHTTADKDSSPITVSKVEPITATDIDDKPANQPTLTYPILYRS